MTAELFVQFGLSEQKAKETAANKKLSANLEEVINEIGIENASPYSALLYTLASTITKDARDSMSYIARAITSKRLLTSDQVAAAIKYAESSKDIVDKDFDSACGVGVVINQKEIDAAVAKVFEEKKEDISAKRYQILGSLLASLRTGDMRWAAASSVKAAVDKKLLEVLGPKDDRDSGKDKAPKETTATKNSVSAPAAPAKPTIAELARSSKFVFEGALAQLHKAGENPQINPELIKEHLKRTGGKVVTRFPPEPNGFLHIGHAKALNVNFGYAAAHGGITYLRYDDTNPEAEEEIYFSSILETLEWMGFKPHAITYSSDHFQRLFDLAVDLIKRDKAYVCHCSGEEIHRLRGGDSKGPRGECVHRNRPIEESLKEFFRMKNGEYKEGEAILRMKMDMSNPNPQFWDLVAYRVLYTAHHRTGDAWCIYPTYDYTHCLCDSFEDITHSLCTTEFTLSRESYYWLVDALEIYKPVQWEYGRLNLTYAILSKRKLLKLVNEKIVNGWDDPRLYTLMALRRRGFTPEAISAFARDIGVTTSNSVIPVERLENYVRDHLNDIAPRIMAVMEPLKVTLTNLPENFIEYITVPNKPRDDSFGSHKVPLTRTLYIDASDFKEESDPNFFRLTLGQTVGLLYVPFPIKAEEIVKGPDGKIVEIKATYLNAAKTPAKPKTYIQWVADSPKDKSPVSVEVRMYENLFLHPNPVDKTVVPGGWLTDINPHSLRTFTALAEVGIANSKVEDKFQFVRVGYFCVDKDSDLSKGKIVVNRTVSLKEDSSKQ
ncbi:tRNA synthetases class I, catalytic domain-containing protein [Chytridium lagenaria]|nr:tRNA synthetases class I, catalytic domain-containing protein [Chytridium lagenaria]